MSWDGRLYLHVQPCDGGYDYTIYDKGTMRALDGGQLDAPELPLSTAALKICEMHDMGGQSIQYAPLSMIETLQEAAVQQMQAAAQAAAPGNYHAAGRPGAAPGRVPHAGPHADPGRFGKERLSGRGPSAPLQRAGL